MQATAVDPFEAEAYHRLAQLFLRQGDRERGEKLLAIFQRIQPVSGEIERFRYILGLYPDDASAHYNLGVLYGGLGRYAEAAVEYAEALRINDQDLSARNNLANVLLRQGKVDEAIKHYEYTLSLNPRYAKGYNNLGAAFMMGGDLKSAAQAFARALKLDPDNPDVHFHLARLYQSQGLEARAAAEMERYEEKQQAAAEKKARAQGN